MNDLATTNIPTPFAIPTADQCEFAKYSKAERLRVLDILAAFKIVDGAKKKCEVFKAIAAVNVGRRGFSSERLRKLYDKYVKSSYDWRVICNNYRGGRPAHSPEFVKFFCGLVAEHKGRLDTVRAARDHLIYDYWKAGKPVPGYGTFAEFWQSTQGNRPFPRIITDKPPHTPAWSIETLSRIVRKHMSKEVRVYTAIGDLHAHDHQAQLFRSREGLMPLQYVTFDDVDLDIEAICKIGNEFKVRPLQAVMALDIATGMFLAWGLRPLLTNEDIKQLPNEVGQRLTRKQVNEVLMRLLLMWGLPERYPMRLLLENASGTLNSADREMIEALLPARILFENTRMFNESYLGLECRKHGLPYQKGYIESPFQGLHTRLSGLPGALAPRYDSRHPSAAALIEDTKKVLDDANAKGIDATLLKFKLLPFQDFLPIFDLIVSRWNARTNHKLQGFEYEYETLIGSDYYTRADALKLLTDTEYSSAKFVRRMESPIERFNRLSCGLPFTKLEVPTLYPLMQTNKRILKVRNGQITTEWSNISPDKFIYRAPELAKLEGRELVAVTPDRENLWLFTKEEGFVCVAPQLGRIPIVDQEAIIRQSGIVAREREKQRALAEELQADRKNWFRQIDVHNQAVLENAANYGTAMREREIRAKESQKTDAKTSYAAQTDRFARQAAIARNDEENDF
ncbi:MAG: hypothetical protein IKS15_04550 [Opitutales bacterium]|nr:hypothetical protein [Opitutales bacterium]